MSNVDLITALTALAEQAQVWFAAAALVFLRVGAVFALVPAFGEQMVPMRARLAGSIAMGIVVAPAVLDRLPPPPSSPLRYALFAGAETLNGFLLAMALRLMIMALQMAGTKAAQATSLSQAFGGSVDPQPATARILTLAGLALMVMMGLPEILAQLIVLSYDVLPAGVWPQPASVAEWGIGRISHAFALSFTLAAPFVIGAGLYNLALGAINRAMPQLMVAFVGAPALTFGGLVLLMIAAPMMLQVWTGTLQEVLTDPLGLP